MKRILVPNIPTAGMRVAPDADECRHLIRVRRVRDGEEVEILDGQGNCAIGKLVLLSRNHLEVVVDRQVKASRESPLHLEVAVAIPAQLSTLDGFLPGLTQLGVSVIYLAVTKWSGRLKKGEDKYLSRLEKITLQSLKQCGRTLPPEIRIAGSWEHLCKQMVSDNQANLLFHPVPDTGAPPDKLDSLGLIIGAEAGFSDEEVGVARKEGIMLQGLGPRILKMETAVIGACYQAQRDFGDLRN